MRALTTREKWLLGICFGVVFLIANGFAARVIFKNLRGSGEEIRNLQSILVDHEMWLAEAEKAAARDAWLRANMPTLAGSSLGKEQGDLLQALQDEILDRKLKIEQQSLQDIVHDGDFSEVAVRLTVRGDEKTVVEWLTTLQDRDKFVVIKAMEIKLDPRSREAEPQAVCQITVARWFLPEEDGTMTTAEPSERAGGQG